jgi:hypothetical protein
MNRTLLTNLAPESFERVDGFFYDLYRDYLKRRSI